MKVTTHIIAILVLISSFISYANNNLVFNTANSLLLKNHSREAYELLKVNHHSDSTNPQEYFLLAMASKNIGKVISAKKYLNKAIKLSPNDNARLKLELANLEYQLGNSDIAKEHLVAVQATNPPKMVGDNIGILLTNIENGTAPKNYSVSVNLGYLSDSNVNAGPSVDSILMFGLPFTLSADAKENSDNAVKYGISFNHNKILTDAQTWQTSASFNATNYRKLHNYDSISLALSTGPSYKMGSWFISSPIVYDRVKIGHENSYYSYSYGIAPQFRNQITKQLAQTFVITTSKKKYQSGNNKDTKNHSLTYNLNYQINPQSYMSFGLNTSRIDSKIATSDNKTNGLNLSYGYGFANGVQLGLSANYSKTKYQGVEVAYGKTRDDNALNVGVNASYAINAKQNISLSISRTNNNSNIEMYQYKHKQTNLNWNYRF
jgi:tetratricopeptide (TPR) repeat protein